MEQLGLNFTGVADATVTALPGGYARLGDVAQRYTTLGAPALSLPELVALVRCNDPAPEDVDAARHLLAGYADLRQCIAETPQLRAAIELAARVQTEHLQRQKIDRSRDAAALMQARIGCEPHEVFVVAFLDNRKRLIQMETMFRGTVDGASVHPREVVRAALKYNAQAVLCGHNHPSGVAEPSAADRNITRQLTKALNTIGVQVIDHLVVGAGTVTSMAARGLI